MQLCPSVNLLDDICDIELMLVSQLLLFMFIVPKVKGAQYGLKGQCVLVPSDLKKVQNTLPRTFDERIILSLALKRRLTDKSNFCKQNISPANVNLALQKLSEINPLYSGVTINDEWEQLNEENDPELWQLLTSQNVPIDEQSADSDEEVCSSAAQEQIHNADLASMPTVMHNIDGPSITTSDVVNIAPGEGQIPVSIDNQPDWEPLAFPREFSTGNHHINSERNVPVSMVQ